MTTGALWKNEEGNVVSVREAHALFVGTAQKAGRRSRTRPSLGPETRARQSALNSGVARRRRCRGGRDIAVGQTCVSGRNRQRGHDRTDACAACRASPLLEATRGGRALTRQKRKVVMAIVPARKTRVPDLSSVRRKQLQKSTGSILASNKHVRSAPKRVAVRVNGGLGGAASGGNTSGAASIETMSGASVLHQTLHGEGPA